MYRAGRLARVRTLEEVRGDSNHGIMSSTYWKDRATLAEKRIEELERSIIRQADRSAKWESDSNRVLRLERELDTEVNRVRACQVRISELEQSLTARENLLLEATTTLRSVKSEVFHPSVAESMALIEDVDGDPGSHMARVIRQIQGAV